MNNTTHNTDEESQILYEARSIEANEILGNMPSWITRWGITVVGLFLLILLALAAFIKYPYTVKADIVISNENGKLTTAGMIKPCYYAALKSGQIVLINLDAYPAQEFGFIEGVVTRIPDSSANGQYTFTIDLGNAVKPAEYIDISNYKSLNGTGDILIDEKSILRRILENIRL